MGNGGGRSDRRERAEGEGLPGDGAAIYAYSYPAYLELAEAQGVDPKIKIGMTEREAVQRIADQERLTGSLERPEILRVWPQATGTARAAEALMHRVLDAFGRREASDSTGTEVFRVNLTTLDALAQAFGWVATDAPRSARRRKGAEGPSKDAWRTGRNTAVSRWGFTYPQCARDGCGRAIDATSPTGAGGLFIYCSVDCAQRDDEARSTVQRSEGKPGRQAGDSSRDAWRSGRNNTAAGWGLTYRQCAMAKCGQPISDDSPRGGDGKFIYCSEEHARIDDTDRGIATS